MFSRAFGCIYLSMGLARSKYIEVLPSFENNISKELLSQAYNSLSCQIATTVSCLQTPTNSNETAKAM